jgi:hypothetical protein
MQEVRATSNPRISVNWLFSQWYDLAFFFLPIPVAAGIFLLLQSSAVTSSQFLFIALGSAFGAEQFHLGITAVYYLDKKNRDHYLGDRNRMLIFFLVPPLIFALTLIGQLLSVSMVFFIYMCWSIQHLVQQNMGILLLYHNHNRDEAIVNRKLEQMSQYAASVFFTLVFFRRVFLHDFNWLALDVVLGLSLLVMLIYCGGYLYELSRQVKEGKTFNIPAFFFWALAVCSLSPLAFLGHDFVSGFFIPVMVHWFQYIGLNYRIFDRKYSSEQTGNLQDLISPHPKLLFFVVPAVLVVSLMAIINYTQTFAPSSVVNHLLKGLVFSTAMTHYFLDAFLYRFRDSFQRETILKYLRG